MESSALREHCGVCRGEFLPMAGCCQSMYYLLSRQNGILGRATVCTDACSSRTKEGAHFSLKRQRKHEVSQTSKSRPMQSSTKGRKVSTAWRGRIMRLSLLVSEAVRHLLNSHWHLAGPVHAHTKPLRAFILILVCRIEASSDRIQCALTRIYPIKLCIIKQSIER